MALNFLNNGYFAGSVGIGEQSPSAKLQITTPFASSPSDCIFLFTNGSNTPGGGSEIIFGSSTSATPVNYNAKIQVLRSALDDGSSDMRFLTTHVATATFPDTKMIIKSDGNVGIGTISPLRKLHVGGNFAVNAGTGEYYGVNITGGEGANPNILIGDWHNSSANIKWDSSGNYLRIDAQHSTSGAPIVFSGNDSAIEYMRIASSGNVGIGTTNPTSLLEISKQLSAASTIDYPYTISSRDDANSINQAGGEGVGIKFRIAGNAATTPGDSLVGASIAAIRESSSDSNSSTGLGFFVTQNDETLDEALRIDHDRNIQFNAYGAGTLVSDASGNITVSSGGGAGGPYLPLAGGTMAGTITMNNNRITSIEELRFNNGGNIGNQINTDVDTGTETVANVEIATYTAAFFDFVIKKTTNVRSGTVYACHDGTNVEFTETSTNDLGDTSDVTLSVDISGTNMRLRATSLSESWSVKSLIRAI